MPLETGEEVVIVGLVLTVSDSALVVVAETLSVTRTVKLEVPAADGVPLIVPLLDRLKPMGSAPLASAHV